MKRLLFVCMGNICRSPIAEGVMRHQLDRHGLDHIEVDSAGTGDWHAGRGADARAQRVAKAHGIDIVGHVARQIATRDYEEFDWILCADRENLNEVLRRAPAGLIPRCELVLEAAGFGSPVEVPDPYYGDERDFEAVYALLARAAESLVQKLRAGP